MIVAVSDFEKSLICHDFRISEDKVKVIPNGVDFSEFEGLKRRDHDGRTILYVGYLAAYKGAQYLVEVLPKLPKDVRLKIVGRGPMKPFLEKRALELGVSGRIDFYSNLSRKDLLQMYAEADVFALLSRYEAYSIAVAEALTVGTPCVVARTSALTEWEDGETCLGVDFPLNLGQLSEKITCQLDANLTKAAFSKWHNTKILDWNKITEQLEEVYAE
jgi:glycosyltransferase involved in cell wall biosynthesis